MLRATPKTNRPGLGVLKTRVDEGTKSEKEVLDREPASLVIGIG